MAVTFNASETVTRGHSYWLSTQDIDIDAENNGRHDLPNIERLTEDIRREGQLVPCIIRKDGGRAVMVEGHSRWRAICEINKGLKADDRRKVWCVYFDGNEVDALAIGFASNRERNSLTPVDEGYFISRMLKFSKTIEDVAKIVREDVAWCKNRLALVSLVPEAQAAVSSGEIKPSAAKALAKLAAADQRRAMKERDTKGRVTTKTIKKSQPVVERPASAKELRTAIEEVLALITIDADAVKIVAVLKAALKPRKEN